MTKIKDVLITDRVPIKTEGFAKIDRLTVMNIYEDGTGMKYPCEMVWRDGHDAACIVPFCEIDGKYFVVLRTQSRPIFKLREGKQALHPSLPGGCIAPGQDPHDCAVHELEEEVGVKLEPNQYVMQLGNPLYSSVGWTSEKIYFYQVFLTDEQVKNLPLDGVPNISGEVMEEGASLELVPLSSAMRYAQCEMFEVAIRRLQDMLY